MTLRSGDRATVGEILRVSLPLTVGMLGILIMMLVDRICLARYSAETLQASGPAVFTATTVIVVFTATAGIAQSFVAQAYGRGSEREVARAFGVGLALALGLAVVLLALSPAVAHIPNLLTGNMRLAHLESVYLQWALLFGAVMVVNMALTGLFNGTRRTRVTMVIGLIGQGVDVICTVGFVFGRFGLPELGMRGAAAGTLVAVCCMLVAYAAWIPRSLWREAARAVRSLGSRLGGELVFWLRRGGPSGLAFGLDELGQTAFVWLAGILGGLALGVNNVILAVNYLAIIPIIGFGTGCGVLCGSALGERAFERIPHVIRVTVAVCGVYVAFVAIVQIFFARWVLLLFGIDRGAALELGVATSAVLWTYSLTFTFSMIGSAVLTAFGLARVVLLIRLVGTWALSVPLIAAVSVLNRDDPHTLVWAWLIGSFFEALAGGVMFWRIARAVRRRENFLERSGVQREAAA